MFSLSKGSISSTNSIKSFHCRRENHSIDRHPKKISFNIQIHQLKKRLQLNRNTFDRIKENLLSINQDQSFLFNQISRINTQAFHLRQHLHSLENKSQILEQQISHLQKNIDQIKGSIDENERKLQRLTNEQGPIVRFLLEKQRWIVRMNQYVQWNDKHLRQCRLADEQILPRIARLRKEIFRELHLMNSFERRDQTNYKHKIFFLQKQVLETRKNKNHFEHQQILTRIKLNKSIRKSKK